MQIDYKRIIFWVIFSLIFLGVVIFLIFTLTKEKRLEIIQPTEGAELRAGETYEIKWQATPNITNIGILLIKGETNPETKWLAKDIPAREGKYEWPVFVWEKTGQDYKIAILEYPWQEGGKVAYSGLFTIVGPEFASCDEFSIAAEWPFVPSDYPNLRKVFITPSSFNGNLDNLDGADAKCQAEAEKLNLGGKWVAFLGNDSVLAVDRISHEGIFVDAMPQGVLPLNKTCFRLLGKNFDDFFKKLTNPLLLNEKAFDPEFLRKLQNVWLGRVTAESKKECLFISDILGSENNPKKYSFTVTCQNWTTDASQLPGYLPPEEQEEQKVSFPECYTSVGTKINAVGLAGLATDLIGEKMNKVFIIDQAKSCQ
ncbi:MAG: GPI anchored serine-threonine rich family protein, partial [Minisyncoccales bacterium]